MHSKLHPYLHWAKERLDEMDAVLATLEIKLDKVQSESRARADQLLAELRNKRDHFYDIFRKQANEGEAAWLCTQVGLESEWGAFQAQVRQYVETFADRVEQQQATFRILADTQLKSWRAATDELRNQACNFTAVRRKEAEAAVRQMNADATAAEQKLRKFSHAGAQSWSAMMVALTETRTAFDRANQAATEAFKRAGD